MVNYRQRGVPIAKGPVLQVEVDNLGGASGGVIPFENYLYFLYQARHLNAVEGEVQTDNVRVAGNCRALVQPEYIPVGVLPVVEVVDVKVFEGLDTLILRWSVCLKVRVYG
jgi:hypothetical protein